MRVAKSLKKSAKKVAPKKAAKAMPFGFTAPAKTKSK